MVLPVWSNWWLLVVSQTIDWNKNILKFFLIQEKVYFCKRDNLEYVKYQ